MSLMRRFIADDHGATAIEYGLIVALIFLVIVGVVTAFASKVTAMFEAISTAIVAAIA